MIDLAPLGVWQNTGSMVVSEATEFAARIEELGYSMLWMPENLGRDPFAHIAHLANHTSTLGFATGIANIHHRLPGVTKQAALTLAEQTGNRFLLGLGVSHAPLVEGIRKLEYRRPIETTRAYLEAMHEARALMPVDEHPITTVLAALGPRMLALSRDLTDGAHPYWTTPDHTAEAREILGPDKLLLVEQKVCLTTDATAARTAGIDALQLYMRFPNYINNWLRLGFSEDDIEQRSDRFVDGLVVWGDEAAVAAGVRAHYDAGADHVCVQPLIPGGPYGRPDLATLEALAPVNE